MKKIIALLFAFLFLSLMSLPVYADLGGPAFDDWYVVCGVNGFDFDDLVVDYENGNEAKVREHIEPGIKLQVFEYYDSTKQYLLVIADENFTTKGKGFVYVTESELEKNFLDAKKTVSKETGKKLEEEVNCVVTANSGVVLRQGPAKTFARYALIPNNANLSYQYTYAYGGYNWGYTTYNGKSGWLCIDYTQKAADVTETTAEPATETATQPLTETGTELPEPSADVTEPGADVSTSAQSEETQASGFFSNTKVVILVCCLGAVILALTAIVILLIVKKKND